MQVINCRAKTYLGRGDDPSSPTNLHVLGDAGDAGWVAFLQAMSYSSSLTYFSPICASHSRQRVRGLNKQHGALLLLVGNASE